MGRRRCFILSLPPASGSADNVTPVLYSLHQLTSGMSQGHTPPGDRPGLLESDASTPLRFGRSSVHPATPYVDWKRVPLGLEAATRAVFVPPTGVRAGKVSDFVYRPCPLCSVHGSSPVHDRWPVYPTHSFWYVECDAHRMSLGVPRYGRRRWECLSANK